jgi:hypothetical protein
MPQDSSYGTKTATGILRAQQREQQTFRQLGELEFFLGRKI